jgi:hypothetical protein
MIRLELEKELIDDVSLRYCQIYKITNLKNNKVYVGQAVSHILNHKRYRPYGMVGRFNCHVSEAFSEKTKQCHYLNSSIRKHGRENFTVELLCNCLMEDADRIETEEILKHNSLFPTGYNLKTGGQHFTPTEESRRRVSVGVIKMTDEKKLEKYENVIFDVETPDNTFIKKRPNDCIITISGIKTIFGGTMTTPEQNYERCIQFINILKTNIIERQNTLLLGHL